MDMPVFFASIDEKNQISIHTTYSGIKSNTKKPTFVLMKVGFLVRIKKGKYE